MKKFNEKIVFKLGFAFAFLLILFSIIISSIFIFLFKKHTVDVHKEDLLGRANFIATSLTNYVDGGNKKGGMNGYGAFLKNIYSIAGADVWIIDSNLELVTAGKGVGNEVKSYNYKDLPPSAEKIIDNVFKGKTEFSQEFSSVLDELTLTIGVPVKNNSGNIVSVVLIHSPIYGINKISEQGFMILITSVILAFIFVFVVSIYFSLYFAKPLIIMESDANNLAIGKYNTKNNISQNDEIGKLAKSLNILADKLYESNLESEKLDQARKDFLTSISHELKTPITIMRGSLEALVDNIVTNPDKINEYHHQMLNEVTFLQRLVGDLFELSKLQSTDFKIDKSKIILSDLVNDSLRSAKQLAVLKNIKINTQIENNNTEFIGDYERLRQMLLIIIDNAIKFSSNDSEINIILANNILYVEDFGIGISEKEKEFIFDRFYKESSDINKSGTGLGLAIAKQIADRHGIRIEIDNLKSKGTTFIFKFN